MQQMQHYQRLLSMELQAVACKASQTMANQLLFGHLQRIVEAPPAQNA